MLLLSYTNINFIQYLGLLLLSYKSQNYQKAYIIIFIFAIFHFINIK